MSEPKATCSKAHECRNITAPLCVGVVNAYHNPKFKQMSKCEVLFGVEVKLVRDRPSASLE
jgi:hypothetical protein